MAAITIPLVGEVYTGDNPSPIKIARCTLSATSGDVLGIAQTTYALFSVPANCLVLEVMAYTPTAWTASTTIGIGDGDSTSGWLATAVIAPTSAQTNGLVKSTNVATAAAYAGGRIYLAADTIDAIIAGATPVVGKTEVFIKYILDYTAL